MIRAGQLNFSKGILSERLLGRVDVAAYNAGVRQGENVIILKQGALTIRPGFEIVSLCQGPGERLVPFQFSNEQAYALAFGQGYMQPLTDGGVVTEDELVIEDATSHNPMVLTARNHGFVAGDRVFVVGVQGALGRYLNNRVWPVSASLDDDRFSIPLDGTSLPPFMGSEGGIVRDDPPPPPPAVPPTPPPYVPPPAPPVYGGGIRKSIGNELEEY